MSISEKEVTAITVKTVILGEPGVGKTCIVNRLVNNDYREVGPSMGVAHKIKFIFFPNYDRSVKFEVWDTLGQEKYRTFNKMFYREAKVAILVYDITRKSSFEEIKNYWSSEIKENSSNDTSK